MQTETATPQYRVVLTRFDPLSVDPLGSIFTSRIRFRPSSNHDLCFWVEVTGLLGIDAHHGIDTDSEQSGRMCPKSMRNRQ